MSDEGLAKGRAKSTERRLSSRLLPRQEKFCQLMADASMTQTQALISAGYSAKNARSSANKLLANPKIQARIHELRIEAGKRNEVNLDEVIEGLRRARDEAESSGQYSAAIRATELLGKYLGMFSDKISVSSSGAGSALDTNRLAKIGALGGARD